MNRLLICALITFLVLSGCLGPSSLAVTPASPADGSTVISLTPTLSWGGGEAGADYRIVIASDSNFQSIIVDVSNLGTMGYTVPASKLNSNSLYYWRVLAKKGDQVSNWSTFRSFRTPGSSPGNIGNIAVNATLDGAPWSGQVNFRISGPYSDSENTAPWSFNGIPAGAYTFTYNYGGPCPPSYPGLYSS